jgi:hypothetical protein
MKKIDQVISKFTTKTTTITTYLKKNKKICDFKNNSFFNIQFQYDEKNIIY